MQSHEASTGDEGQSSALPQRLDFVTAESYGFSKRLRSTQQGGSKQYWELQVPVDKCSAYVAGEEARNGCTFRLSRGGKVYDKDIAFQLKDGCTGELRSYNKVKARRSRPAYPGLVQINR